FSLPGDCVSLPELLPRRNTASALLAAEATKTRLPSDARASPCGLSSTQPVSHPPVPPLLTQLVSESMLGTVAAPASAATTSNSTNGAAKNVVFVRTLENRLTEQRHLSHLGMNTSNTY